MSQATSASAIAKREARDTGQRKYEGKPCKQCRFRVRYTSCGSCCHCACIRAAVARAA